MTSEEHLNNIKHDLINNLKEAIFEYIEEYWRDDGSSEGYQNLASQETLVYTFKTLIATHFPEFELNSFIETTKHQSLEKLKEENQEEIFKIKHLIKDLDSMFDF